MKSITVRVSDATYDAFYQSAVRTGQSVSQIVRQALEEYRQSHLQSGTSIFDSEPADVGRLLVELSPTDDTLGEMLAGRLPDHGTEPRATP